MSRRLSARRTRILFASLSSTLVFAVALAVVLLFSGARAEAASYTMTSTSMTTNWSDPSR